MDTDDLNLTIIGLYALFIHVNETIFSNRRHYAAIWIQFHFHINFPQTFIDIIPFCAFEPHITRLWNLPALDATCPILIPNQHKFARFPWSVTSYDHPNIDWNGHRLHHFTCISWIFFWGEDPQTPIYLQHVFFFCNMYHTCTSLGT